MIKDRPDTQVIVALDVPDIKEAASFVLSLKHSASWFKVGLELFTAAGPRVVEMLTTDGYCVMLDLKMHDIPETVSRAVKRGCDLGARMLTVHAGGGAKMLEAAQKAAEEYNAKILAVTVLTSLDQSDMQQLGIGGTSTVEYAKRLADLAYLAGVRGIVCSAHEVKVLKALHSDMTFVVPGIRPAGGEVQDQKRVATPASAREEGADYIVVGRPIRDAADRPGMVHSMMSEMGTSITAEE